MAACFLRDDDGALVAGIDGFTWGGYAQIDFLWVTAELRAQGLGRRLVEAAEAEAEARGCRTIVLGSHSFQAPAMYRRLGYAEVGVQDDAPIGDTALLLPEGPVARAGVAASDRERHVVDDAVAELLVAADADDSARRAPGRRSNDHPRAA